MRRLFVLAVLLATAPLFAGELLQPEDYLALMTKSKLTYLINDKPVKKPMAPMAECGRRTESTRVVRQGNDKKLVDWPVKPEAATLIQEAEPLFQAQQYDDAARMYQHAIEIDPEAIIAIFGYGDTLLFGKHDAAAALEQYQKGVALDPTLPIGYFFSATALMHLGRTADAREMMVKALALYPSYEALWKVVQHNPHVVGARPIVRHPFEPPADLVGEKTGKSIEVYIGKEAAWIGYATCKAVWANESKFAKERGGKGLSQDEERACVFNQLTGTYNRTAAQLEKTDKNLDEAKVVAALPPLEKHLYDVAKSQLLDGYVLFEIIGQRCPLAMSLIDDESRKQVEEYVRKYVLVPEAEGQTAAAAPSPRAHNGDNAVPSRVHSGIVSNSE